MAYHRYSNYYHCYLSNDVQFSGQRMSLLGPLSMSLLSQKSFIQRKLPTLCRYGTSNAPHGAAGKQQCESHLFCQQAQRCQMQGAERLLQNEQTPLEKTIAIVAFKIV